MDRLYDLISHVIKNLPQKREDGKCPGLLIGYDPLMENYEVLCQFWSKFDDGREMFVSQPANGSDLFECVLEIYDDLFENGTVPLFEKR